jgi:hypothetical protein
LFSFKSLLYILNNSTLSDMPFEMFPPKLWLLFLFFHKESSF